MKQYNSKEIISFWLAFIASVIAVTALIIPPRGSIDQSVLVLIGQFLVFIACLLGVNGAVEKIEKIFKTKN